MSLSRHAKTLEVGSCLPLIAVVVIVVVAGSGVVVVSLDDARLGWWTAPLSMLELGKVALSSSTVSVVADGDSVLRKFPKCCDL